MSLSETFQQFQSKKLHYGLSHGDCIEEMAKMPEASVDFAAFSPPFPSVYSYTDLPEDLGNSEDLEREAPIHFSWFFRGLKRILKPGRVAIVHCQQIPRMKRVGGLGLYDFRGLLIRIAQRSGLVYEYDWLVRKGPQAQCIRTKSREMQFAGLEADRSRCRGALGDYLIKFMAPGKNKVPVNYKGEVSRNDWIDWAEAAWWDDIIETDTLNTKPAKSEDDVKHICALQLEVIRRCILLYSNPGEIVFSPFAGIGSEGYVALGGKSPKTKLRIKKPRRFYGCEIKDEYYNEALLNLKKADSPDPLPQKSLLEELGDEEDYSLPCEESSGTCSMPFTLSNFEDNEE